MAEALMSSGTLQALVDSMSQWERETWKLIVRRVGAVPFTLAALGKFAYGRFTGAQLMVSAIRLCRKGLLAQLRNKRGDTLYAMPADLFEICSGMVRTPFIPATTEIDDEVVVTRSASVDLARQLFCLLVYLRLNPLKLTRSGEVPKRVAVQIASMLDGLCEDADLRMKQLIDLGCAMQLLRREADLLEIDARRTEAWIRLSEDARNLMLYEYWMSGLTSESVANTHAMLAMQRVTVWQWFPLAQLIQSLAEDDIIEDEQTALLELVEWIKPLADCGWFDLGESGSGVVCRLRICLQWSSVEIPVGDGLNEQDRRVMPQWVVQPDFEVLVPPGVPFAALWELEMMAERRQLDSVCVYKLTKESVQRAAVVGRNSSRCLEWLRRHALYEIPENVILGINRWFSGFDDMPNADAGAKSGEGESQRVDGEESFFSFDIPNRPYLDGYEVVVKLPEEEELLREWRDVPPLWLKQSRPYHLSVRKQIVRQALEWQTAVELGQENECMTVQPLHIDERSGETCFVGRVGMKEETIILDSWNRIRLLLPGVNE
jgi:hypothetical protein